MCISDGKVKAFYTDCRAGKNKALGNSLPFPRRTLLLFISFIADAGYVTLVADVLDGKPNCAGVLTPFPFPSDVCTEEQTDDDYNYFTYFDNDTTEVSQRVYCQASLAPMKAFSFKVLKQVRL